jgi:methylmalonyl-CoA mutase N-terminal domain/subunit
LALRTQQVLAHETGVTNTVDPLGGSYFIEALTRQMKSDAQSYFEQIDRLGGVLGAIEAGFFRRAVAEASFAYQREVDAGRKLIVGVNAFQERDEPPIEVHEYDGAAERDQVAALRRLKERRDRSEVRRALDDLRRAASGNANLMPPLLEAATARVTVGEVMDALADVFGRYDGSAVW